MIRSFTILILTVAQVLSGLGCGGYLCLRRDGTICCVDQGAEGCDCCADSAESLEGQSEDQCCSHQHNDKCGAVAENSTDGNVANEQQKAHSDGFAALESLLCGCNHVPVCAPAARVDRGLVIGKVESCRNFFRQFNRSSLSQAIDSKNGRSEPFLLPTSHAIVLLQHSCIVMRC